MSKPKIYSFCDAGCKWEVAHKSETLRQLVFENVQIATTDWESDSSNAACPYKATIALSGVSAAMLPELYPANTQLLTIPNYPETYNGGIIIHAAQKPTASLVIPKIICLALAEDLEATEADV